MQQMRSRWSRAVHYYEDEQRVPEDVAAELDAYRYDEDDSEIICPGSTFTGEFEPPAPRNQWGESYPEWTVRVGEGYVRRSTTWDDGSARLPAEVQFPRPLIVNPTVALDGWRSLSGFACAFTHGAYWWRCDDIRSQNIHLRHMGDDTDWRPDRIVHARTVVVAGSEQVELHRDRADHSSARSGIDSATGDLWMEIYCPRPPTVGDWHLRDETAILDLDDVRRLKEWMISVAVAEEGRPDRASLDSWIARGFASGAERHFPGAWIDPADLVWREADRDWQRNTRTIEVRWRQPYSDRVEFRDGPGHGSSRQGVNVQQAERIIVAPRLHISSWADEDAYNVDLLAYQRAGWNTVTKSWVYRPLGYDSGQRLTASSFPTAEQVA
jgi:hypothetical protein